MTLTTFSKLQTSVYFSLLFSPLCFPPVMLSQMLTHPGTAGKIRAVRVKMGLDSV